ncbi:MAG: cytochrome c3 family protein [bacterium]|nr:cytochrome c3 family protein [bacterium]
MIINNYKRCIPTLIVIFLCMAILPVAVQSDEVTSETCLDCHEEMEASLNLTVHAVTDASKNTRVTVSCMDCHSGAEAHVEDPATDNIGNPASQSGARNFDLCSTCHSSHVSFNDFGFTAHFSEQVNCGDCHKVHANSPSLLRDRSGLFCLACHDDKKDALFQSSSHPSLDNGPSCLSCHAASSQGEEELVFDLNGICADCHPQHSGPFLYEHEPMNAYSIEGSGCMECHEPHGSHNDRLVTQEGNDLCNRCHVPPSGHKMAHGGWFADFSCNNCHTEVHGSYTSNLFLAEDLPARYDIGLGSCYNSGCHSLNK